MVVSTSDPHVSRKTRTIGGKKSKENKNNYSSGEYEMRKDCRIWLVSLKNKPLRAASWALQCWEFKCPAHATLAKGTSSAGGKPGWSHPMLVSGKFAAHWHCALSEQDATSQGWGWHGGPSLCTGKLPIQRWGDPLPILHPCCGGRGQMSPSVNLQIHDTSPYKRSVSTVDSVSSGQDNKRAQPATIT